MRVQAAITLLSSLIPGQVMAAGPLDDLKWVVRPVLVFGSTPDHPQTQLQLDALRLARDGVAEREMVLISVFTDHVEENGVITRRSAADLRHAYDVPEGQFQLLLIGKDGSVKSRRKTYVEPEILFTEIDGMPMRRNEMRRHAQ